MKRFSLFACCLALAGCGSAAYYDVVVVDAEMESSALADIRSSETASNEAPARPIVDLSTTTLDGFRDAPSDMIPPVERMRRVRYWARHPELRERCVQTIDVARAHMSRAIQSAIAINDTQRLRCLSRSARDLLTLKHMALGRQSADGGDELACDGVPDIVEDARACR